MEKGLAEGIEYPINTIVNSLLTLLLVPINTILMLFSRYGALLTPHISLDL